MRLIFSSLISVVFFAHIIPICGEEDCYSRCGLMFQARDRIYQGTVDNEFRFAAFIKTTKYFHCKVGRDAVPETQLDVSSCTGSIIDNQAVLTAAHCFKIQDPCPGGLTVFASPSEVTVTVRRGHKDEQNLAVTSIHLHPSYRTSSGSDNDIAIVKLSQRIRFGQNKGKICLSGTTTETESNVVMYGYGDHLSEADGKKFLSIDDCLRNEQAKIHTVKWCRDKLPSIRWNEEINICTQGSTGGAEGGDSGGPVATMKANNKIAVQLAVATTLLHEDGQEHVVEKRFEKSANVSYYCPWIKTKVETVECLDLQSTNFEERRHGCDF